MKPRVLIGYSACGLTRAAFERAGCEAWTCDLLEARDGSHMHIRGDVREVLTAGYWDAAVLHPMCTYLTCSAAWAFSDPDYVRYPDVGYHQRLAAGTLVGQARREAREEAIENFRWLLGLGIPMALENPAVSFINKAIRPPDQILQPYQFGDDASKATGIWLEGLPALSLDPNLYVEPRICNGRPRWANQTDSGQNRLSPSEDRWLERSKTYPGIAAAMGAQWGTWLINRNDTK